MLPGPIPFPLLPSQEELDSTDTSVVISSCSLAEARLLLDNFLKASIDKVRAPWGVSSPTLGFCPEQRDDAEVAVAFSPSSRGCRWRRRRPKSGCWRGA